MMTVLWIAIINVDGDKVDGGDDVKFLSWVSAFRATFRSLRCIFPTFTAGKSFVIPLLDDLSLEARALGVVNTVVLKEGRRIGHNTDWLVESLFQRGPSILIRDNGVYRGDLAFLVLNNAGDVTDPNTFTRPAGIGLTDCARTGGPHLPA